MFYNVELMHLNNKYYYYYF